jgi:hypothetical protein
MNEELYDLAVRTWIARRFGEDADNIEHVTFDTIQEGYCETCEYTTMGITFYRKEEKKRRWRGRDNSVTLGGLPPAEFVREVSEIYQELVKNA